jgi:hypothetical protein
MWVSQTGEGHAQHGQPAAGGRNTGRALHHVSQGGAMAGSAGHGQDGHAGRRPWQFVVRETPVGEWQQVLHNDIWHRIACVS